MIKKYYKSGLRPIIENRYEDYSDFLAFQWDTGEFEEDMRYNHQINFDPSGEVEELSEVEFNNYVAKLKKERGL